MAPSKRVDRELTTEEWKSILDKAWQAGIPHIVFTGGEPTLRDDLPELISRAEANGQVIRAAQRLLAPFRSSLSGQTLENRARSSHGDLPAWQRVRLGRLSTSLAEDLFVAVHLTLTPETASTSLDLLKWLATQGVKAVSLSISDPSLNDVLISSP